MTDEPKPGPEPTAKEKAAARKKRIAELTKGVAKAKEDAARNPTGDELAKIQQQRHDDPKCWDRF